MVYDNDMIYVFIYIPFFFLWYGNTLNVEPKDLMGKPQLQATTRKAPVLGKTRHKHTRSLSNLGGLIHCLSKQASFQLDYPR